MSIKVRDLVLSIDGATIIKGINYTFSSNAITSILGYSGSGKSSLLKCISGIHKSSGEIIIDDIDINKLPMNKRGISIVFQDNVLFPNMSVMDNLLVVTDKVWMVEYLAKKLNIFLLLDKYPSTLSGGESQRVCIARALLSSNRVILMDEPFSSLDYLTKLIVREVVKDEIKSTNKTCLFVTHDRDDAFYMSESGIILEKGELVKSSKLKSMYDKPGNYNIGSLLGDCNSINYNGDELLIRPEWFKITHAISGIEVVESIEMGYYKKLIISSFHRIIAFDFSNTFKKGDKVKLEVVRKSLIGSASDTSDDLKRYSWLSVKNG